MITFLLSLILSTFNSHAAVVGETCQSHVKMIDSGQRQRMNVAEILSHAAGAKLIFFGESHFENERRKAYREFLAVLKNQDSKLDCLFVEDRASVANPEYELCNQADSLHLNRSLLKSETIPACPVGSTIWASAINQAYDLGMKVFAMDAADECSQQIGSQNAQDVWACRDRAMRQQILARFSDSTCKKAVAIVGAGHVTSLFPGQVALAHLPFGNLPVFRFNFMFSTYEPELRGHDLRWHWRNVEEINDEQIFSKRLCEAQPRALHEDYGFLHSDLPLRVHPYLWLNGRSSGNWFDFEATIVMGRRTGRRP